MKAGMIGALEGARLIGASKALAFKRWAAANGVEPAISATTRKKKHSRWRASDILAKLNENTEHLAEFTRRNLPGPIPECGWL